MVDIKLAIAVAVGALLLGGAGGFYFGFLLGVDITSKAIYTAWAKLDIKSFIKHTVAFNRKVSR